MIVCTGSEWYYFPSHFFLPENSRLEFIQDGFGGQLPQHYVAVNGTAQAGLQPFNDLNQEETSRYVPLDTCDYIVKLASHHTQETSDAVHQSSLLIESTLNQSYIESAFENVLDASASPIFWTRAYFIPKLSRKYNRYRKYSVYKKKI